MPSCFFFFVNDRWAGFAHVAVGAYFLFILL